MVGGREEVGMGDTKAREGMVVNESKSVVMVIGRRASKELIFSICGTPIVEVDRQVYVGFTVTSTGQLLRKHYDVKANQALTAGRMVWSFEQDLGDIKPATAIHLYEALVAPHLMYGCEVALDIVPEALREMKDVQVNILRRIMGLGERSLKDILHADTGVKELEYWRIERVLKYLRYVLSCPPDMWVRAVLGDALALEFEGHRSWITDLQKVIQRLPFTCTLPVLEEWLVLEKVVRLEKEILRGMDAKLQERIDASEKLYLVHGRMEVDEKTKKSRQVPRMRRAYLDLENALHRKSLTRIVTSGHKLAVEVWQYAKVPVPREDRVCRYGCARIVETPEHIWLECAGSRELVDARGDLQSALVQLCTGKELAALLDLDGDNVAVMRVLLSLKHCLAELGRYAYTVDMILEETPLEWK